MSTVSADHRSVIINGKREFIRSGAIHYPRTTPGMWPQLLKDAKRLGLNAIETYVFWEGHEPKEGLFDFTGRYNLGAFLDACQDEGLYTILRIGPYICAEWSFGGLPWWLITKPGMVTRTWNEPFMKAMEHWVRMLMQEVGNRQITRGGSIILAQMENEYDNVSQRYGEDGQRYLAWCSEMARDAGVEVPMFMCEGASPDAIYGLNGFSVWSRVEHLLRERPTFPVLWTEKWWGWYDTWCNVRRRRPIEDVTYELMRFIALGGSGILHYMWHGGTNFGRDAMYMQTTGYDFGHPIDEYGLPTQKAENLALLHHFVRDHQEILLEGDRTPREVLVAGQEEHDRDGVLLYPVCYGDQELDFVVNAFKEPKCVIAQGISLDLPARSAVALLGTVGGSFSVVYKSWQQSDIKVTREMKPAGIPLSWQMIPEPLPGTGPDRGRRFHEVTLPHNMLLETLDETDFGWYRTTINRSEAGTVKLTTRASDMLSVWVNGSYVGSIPQVLKEDRPDPNDFNVEMEIPLQAGTNELLLLVTACGIIKGDWMLNAPQSEEKKGIIAPVLLDCEEIGPWTFSCGFWGEEVKLVESGPASLASWQEIHDTEMPFRWYRAICDVTQAQLAEDLPWALEIGNLFKGMIWVNGEGIGRYWQQPSDPNYQPRPHLHLRTEGIGEPPQHYYRIPTEWICEGRNTIVVLEERGRTPEQCELVRRK